MNAEPRVPKAKDLDTPQENARPDDALEPSASTEDDETLDLPRDVAETKRIIKRDR